MTVRLLASKSSQTVESVTIIKVDDQNFRARNAKGVLLGFVDDNFKKLNLIWNCRRPCTFCILQLLDDLYIFEVTVDRCNFLRNFIFGASYRHPIYMLPYFPLSTFSRNWDQFLDQSIIENRYQNSGQSFVFKKQLTQKKILKKLKQLT